VGTAVSKQHHAFIDLVPRTVERLAVDVGRLMLFPLRLPERNTSLTGLAAFAREDMARMRRRPVAVARPVVVLNGYHAWHGLVASLQHSLVGLVSQRETDFFDVSYGLMTCIHRVRRYVLDEIERVHGLEREIDVVGISMGGLVARLIAREWRGDTRHARVRRIFTLASPHRGATRAQRIHIDAAGRDMMPGSAMLAELNQHVHPELRCYTQLRDAVVGATNTAPPGMEPFWSAGTVCMSHFTTVHNPVFLADIARCLRQEPPLLQAGAASRPISN
jgi:pimeloyl-ACP methyl ester carboxylesterase